MAKGEIFKLFIVVMFMFNSQASEIQQCTVNVLLIMAVTK